MKLERPAEGGRAYPPVRERDEGVDSTMPRRCNAYRDGAERRLASNRSREPEPEEAPAERDRSEECDVDQPRCECSGAQCGRGSA
jgi:hypothetical protein